MPGSAHVHTFTHTQHIAEAPGKNWPMYRQLTQNDSWPATVQLERCSTLSWGNHHSAQCHGGQLSDSTTASLSSPSAPGPNTGRARGSFLSALLPASLAHLPQGQTQGGQGAAFWQHYCQPLSPLFQAKHWLKVWQWPGDSFITAPLPASSIRKQKKDKDGTHNEKSFSPSLTDTRQACSVWLTSGLTQTGRTVVTRAITGIMIINAHRRLKTIITNILHESNNVKHVPLLTVQQKSTEDSKNDYKNVFLFYNIYSNIYTPCHEQQYK